MNKKTRNKLFMGAFLALLAGIFIYFDLASYLTLDYLKESQARFQTVYAEHSFAVVAVYMAIYILVTALSLPGAAILTLAGGAMLGFVMGTIVVSFASTIGATLACLVARFFLRDMVQNKFEDRLKVINEGIDKEGAFYLFSLRLIPVFPFFVINLVMGLTKLPIITFFWVSQLGMIPGTLVFVNAGKELAKIDSLQGIVSPGLIVSFVILGLFPLVVKKSLAIYQARKK